MGGRGGSSNMSGKSERSGIRYSGLDVTTKDGTTRYYFTNREGTNYYQRGIDGDPEPTPLNMSAKEFKQRVEANGATTKPLSNSDYQKENKKYMEERRNKPDYELGVGMKDNRQYRKKARRDRLTTRMMKRKR